MFQTFQSQHFVVNLLEEETLLFCLDYCLKCRVQNTTAGLIFNFNLSHYAFTKLNTVTLTTHCYAAKCNN